MDEEAKLLYSLSEKSVSNEQRIDKLEERMDKKDEKCEGYRAGFWKALGRKKDTDAAQNIDLAVTKKEVEINIKRTSGLVSFFTSAATSVAIALLIKALT